uniref:AIG1-type G domain-containing protein n=1 Tax=Scophthalmus maximus TaxID=52904 RepID=A0A8D3CVA3_SCOMX
DDKKNVTSDPRGRHPPERRLLILGGPQSGKTSTANTILGDEVFDAGTETTHSNVGHTEIYGRRVTVVDTPPWAIPADPEDDTERIRQESQLHLGYWKTRRNISMDVFIGF